MNRSLIPAVLVYLALMAVILVAALASASSSLHSAQQSVIRTCPDVGSCYQVTR